MFNLRPKSQVPGIALVLLALAAYAPALNGDFLWDDTDFVTENATLRSLEGLKNIWIHPRSNLQYFPLTFTSFWIEYHLWGLKSFWYHLNNVLLHGLNGWLLWRLLRRWRVAGAWFAAALFVLHPTHVESVAWITERKDVLSGFFALLALLSWFDRAKDKEWKSLAVALVWFACSLLSKTSTTPLPGVMLLGAWWQNGRSSRRDLARSIPFFLLSLAIGLFHVWNEQRNFSYVREELSFPLLKRYLIAGRALWFYAGKALWPSALTSIYSLWKIEPGSTIPYFFPLFAALAMLSPWLLRNRFGRGPLTAALAFAIMLSPVLGFFSFAWFRLSYVGDHLQYPAGVALTVLFASAIVRTTNRIIRSAAWKIVCISAALGMLGCDTFIEARNYQNAETFWRGNVATNSDSWMGWYNLGKVFDERGDLSEAQRLYGESARIRPDFLDAHVNLGAVLAQQGRLDEAIIQFRIALSIRPDSENARRNLETALEQRRAEEGR